MNKLRLIVSCLIIGAFIAGSLPVSADITWWNLDWNYRKQLTIDNSTHAANLTNFTIGVKLTILNFDFTQAQADGDDIRFIDADDTTLLDYEVVTWDASGEYAEIWVEVPQINASSNTDFILMYWGNAGAANAEDIPGTWSNGYVGVYHMNDVTTSTISDSSASGQGGVKIGSNQPQETSGTWGKAQAFDGDNDYITIAETGDTQIFSALSLLVFLKADDLDSTGRVVTKDGDAIAINQENTHWRYMNDYEPVVSTSAVYTNAYSTIQTTFDGDNIAIYIDGVSEDTANKVVSFNKTQDWLIGRTDWGGYWDGTIDELRISNVARSAIWAAASYDNMMDNYISYGAVVEKPVAPNAPANFTAVINGNNIDLSWDNNILSDSVVIVRGTSSYPVSATDGEVVYTGVAESVTDAGMVNETSEYYYAAFSYNEWGYSTVPAVTKSGGDNMALLAFILLAIGVSFMALRSNFPALKMAAGFGWFAVMMYVKDNPPGTLVEGSSTHQVLILVLILIGAAMLLTAIGGNINRQRNYDGGNASFGDWKWKFGGDKSAWTGGRASNGRETPEQYQLRVRSALRRDVRR